MTGRNQLGGVEFCTRMRKRGWKVFVKTGLCAGRYLRDQAWRERQDERVMVVQEEEEEEGKLEARRKKK